ncbi:MAG TPA: hypothetical protein VEZ90_09025, partial [Blastocatellia bacterium]|nr:hypothetical protein [Blastocatellia bacterium]
FSIDAAAVIREFKWNPDHAAFKIKLNESVEGALITMDGLNTREKSQAEVILDENRKLVIQIPAYELAFSVPGGEHSVEIAITK